MTEPGQGRAARDSALRGVPEIIQVIVCPYWLFGDRDVKIRDVGCSEETLAAR